MQNVLAIILGGGRGTRLHPLTRERSKPAVPLAGKYRLIDIPISNCLNSGIERMYVLTQFLQASLDHHIAGAYRFDNFRNGFVNILPAEQTEREGSDWYQGTADAVRKSLRHTLRQRFDHYLILSGDHIYRMDYRKMIEEHRERGAEITVAALEVERAKVPELGVMEIDSSGCITRFVEKPSDPAVIDSLEIGPSYFENRGEAVQQGMYLGNMGVYLFNRDTLTELLEGSEEDFGKQILPATIEQGRHIYAHRFGGYWEDIGTIRAFFDANLGFTDPVPSFDFFDQVNRIYSNARFLPASKVNGASMKHTLLADGCIIEQANLYRVVVGLRSIIGENSSLRETILMGNDGYETLEDIRRHEIAGRPRVGIGPGCRIERAIIDKNAAIGKGVTLIGGEAPDQQGEGWTLRDSILVVHKDAVIPDGMSLDFSESSSAG